MYGAAILFPGHPYIESATALSNKSVTLYLTNKSYMSKNFWKYMPCCTVYLKADSYCMYTIQLISLNRNPVNRNFRKWVGCEALVPIQDNGSL